MKSKYFRAIGIDLGTTNSAATEIIWDPASGDASGSGAATPPAGTSTVSPETAHVPSFQIRTLEIDQPTREGVFTSPLVPSVVAILPDGTVWVGEGAKRLRAFPTEYGLVFEKNLFYDTKNEMGLRKTYFRAPESFNHASKIGGKVLEFIAREAEKAGKAAAPDRIVVTVPASFMLNQRRDTLLAARSAGLNLADDDLLDEPTAALIDLLMSGRVAWESGEGGGGSADSEKSTPSDADRKASGVRIPGVGDRPCPGTITTGSANPGAAGAVAPAAGAGHENAADKAIKLLAGRPALCVVFDFGGGTCDVSVVEISREVSGFPQDAPSTSAPRPESTSSRSPAASPSGTAPESDSIPSPSSSPSSSLSRLLPHTLSMTQLAVSRFHRLGGGDIDAAIVHDILIPRLLTENGLDPLALTFAQKKKGLEPQLLGKAEALKIAVSSEIARLLKFGRYTSSTDKSAIVVRQPSATCTLGAATYRLSNPSLSAADFERVLAPFLDTDFLFARVTEFRLTQSIFAPLKDAVDRAGRDPSDIDLCLMVGGSSLIPQVRDALRAFFPNARPIFHDDGLEAKLCVSRGAAWNAAVQGLLGRPFIEPVLNDGIALVTADGKLNLLIPSRSTLPFPSDGSFLRERLRVPSAAAAPVRELRFEVVGEQDRQHIFDEVWRLPEGVSPGDEIILEYRLSRGKQFECRASLAASPSAFLEMTVENPLVNIANPNTTQVMIEKAEEELRQRQGGTVRDRDTYVELARMYAELNQREKALDYLRTAQSRLPGPDVEILNLQGIYFAELNDWERSDKAYLEAARISGSWSGPLFNLTISYRQRGLHAEALETIDKAVRMTNNPAPYLTLKALCLDSLGRPAESKEAARKALSVFDPAVTLDDWTLGWLLTAAQMAGDADLKQRVELELRNRKRKPAAQHNDVARPDIWGDGESGPRDSSPPSKPETPTPGAPPSAKRKGGRRPK